MGVVVDKSRLRSQPCPVGVLSVNAWFHQLRSPVTLQGNFRVRNRRTTLKPCAVWKEDAYDETRLHCKSLRGDKSCFRFSGSVDICLSVPWFATRIPASSQPSAVCAPFLCRRCGLYRSYFDCPRLFCCAIATRRCVGSTNSEACVHLGTDLHFCFPLCRAGGAGILAPALAGEHDSGAQGTRGSLAASLDSIPPYWCDCDDAANSPGTSPVCCPYLAEISIGEKSRLHQMTHGSLSGPRPSRS